MSKFKFSVGPWNVHSGADSYGPATRDEIPASAWKTEILKLLSCM